MDALAGPTSSTSLSVTVSAVPAELPAIEPAGRRGRLIRLGARDHVLRVTLHPLVCDARSLGVFAHELGVL